MTSLLWSLLSISFRWKAAAVGQHVCFKVGRIQTRSRNVPAATSAVCSLFKNRATYMMRVKIAVFPALLRRSSTTSSNDSLFADESKPSATSVILKYIKDYILVFLRLLSLTLLHRICMAWWIGLMMSGTFGTNHMLWNCYKRFKFGAPVRQGILMSVTIKMNARILMHA